MAGEFYLSGLSGGFDWQSFLIQYQQLKSVKIQELQYQESVILNKKKAVEQIAEKLRDFLDAISVLKSGITYITKKADLTNPDVADVSVTTDAIEGQYSLIVNQLAQASTYKIGTVNPITDINNEMTTSGSLNIDYLKDGSSQTLSIDYTNKSLKQIMDEINASGDLKAAIINIGTSSSPDYQLVITSAKTGTDNRITGIDDTANPGDDSDGVFSEDSSKTYETVAAQDAQITVNGVDFTSSTNQFNNIITGVNITAKKVGSTDINIHLDKDLIEKNVRKIVDAYNSLLDTVKSLTGKDKPLSGESSFLSMVARISGIIIGDLAKYGFIKSGVTEHGKLSFDSTKFEEFMQNNDFQSILQDFANDLDTYINMFVDTTKTMKKNYDREISYIEDKIDFVSERIKQEVERLRKQFVQLDIYMSQMNELSAKIAGFTAQFGTLPNFVIPGQ